MENEKQRVGRPYRFDLDDLADKLDEWSQKEENLIITQFAVEHNFLMDKIDDYSACNEKFRQAYQRAKQRVGVRRENLAIQGKIPYALYNKHAHNYAIMKYNYDLDKEQLDRDADLQIKLKLLAEEIKLKAEAGEAINLDVVESLNSTLAQLSSLRKDLNIDDNKRRAAAKS